MKKPKVCLACNGGGHFEEMQMAIKAIDFSQYNRYWITNKVKYLKKNLENERHYSLVNPTTNKFLWIINSLQAIFFLIKERPKVIISTGAGVGFPTMFFGKYLFRSKLIFICSAANVTNPSRVPYAAYKICDEFYTQWPEMLEIFPNAKHIGVL